MQSIVISSGAPGPSLAGVTVNAGVPALAGAQRLRVVNLAVAFDQAVQLDANAFT